MKGPRANSLLGQRVRELRLAQGWSQEELGEHCGLDRTYISGIERGVRNPTLTVIESLATGLDISIGELFVKSKGG